MFEFEKETTAKVKKLINKKVILEMDFIDGETIKVIGILTGSETLIEITHDSRKLPIYSGLMADFKIQIIKPTPLLMLANLMRYQNGREIASDQTGILNFRLIAPNYEAY